jgi:protocatechuate 3,4-dioxygenase, alpha subunit
VAADRIPTPSQTVGPFFGFGLPFELGAQAVEPGSPGALRIEGQLLDGAGDPVPDGLLEIWHGDQFARCRTDAEGAFHFIVSKPSALPGPGGRAQAPHLNLLVFARGLLRHLATRIYFPDEQQANAGDPILQRLDANARATLVARRDGDVLHFDVRLQGNDQTAFFSL